MSIHSTLFAFLLWLLEDQFHFLPDNPLDCEEQAVLPQQRCVHPPEHEVRWSKGHNPTDMDDAQEQSHVPGQPLWPSSGASEWPGINKCRCASMAASSDSGLAANTPKHIHL